VAGLPALLYMKVGLQLIDTRAHMEREVERRAFAAIAKVPKAIILSDQSALNLALVGKFAELSPCWNWQANTQRFPIVVQHVIAGQKPGRFSSGRIDTRFHMQDRDVFSRHDPGFLPMLAAPYDPAPMSLRDILRMAWKHELPKEQSGRLIARHPDPYRPHVAPMKP
jgi:hypothetical protein